MSEATPWLAPDFVWYRERLLFGICQGIGSSGHCACVQLLLLVESRVELCLGVSGLLDLFREGALVDFTVKRQGELVYFVPFGGDRIVRQFGLEVFCQFVTVALFRRHDAGQLAPDH